MVVLYIHGMGGGGDSRIPSILRSRIPAGSGLEVVVRTYDFDPETGAAQIAQWVDELHPALVIGESLGSLQALRVRGIPHLFVSPSLNAPLYLGYLAFLALIPGVTPLLDRIWRPREGDRQRLHFTFSIMRKYRRHRRLALANAPAAGSRDAFFAFFGKKDHYRKSGVVSIRTWCKYYGDTYALYDGTHFMEEEFVVEMLVPKIFDILKSKL
ncbi:MAG: hypothetical protein IJ255_03800 [Bacteroidales bacterium]|nr:hypothetical protein [Bacteroidales bacterium]